MSYSTQQLRKTCTTHTNPGLDNPFRLVLPICDSAFHCKVNQFRTNIPFNYTGRCMPKAQRGPLQNQVTAFQCYKITFKNSLSFPYGIPLWQPPSTTYCHRSSQDHTRAALLAPASIFLIYIISYFQKTVLFTVLHNSESRLSGLSPFAVTYRCASMSMQLDLEMCGFRGFAWVLLG